VSDARRLSCRERGVFKQLLAAAKGLNRKVQRGNVWTREDSPSFRVAALLSIPFVANVPLTLESALRFTPWPEEELRGYIKSLRHSHVLQGEHLDVTEWNRPGGLLSFWLDATAGAPPEKIEGCGIGCPHCDARCTRNGRSPNGRQRWRCTSCRRTTSFPGDAEEDRLRVPLKKRRAAARMAKKGYSIREIAKRAGVAKATAHKLQRLTLAGADLTSYKDEMLMGFEPPRGMAEHAERQRVSENPRRRRHYAARQKEEASA
jgi:hypothetical protein